jgi:uncharacterized protein YfiM (DUF2279 family)
MKALLFAIAFLPTLATADEWTGRDKTLHFTVGAAIGGAVTIATDRRDYGIAAGVAVGLAKELYDAQHRSTHTPSAKDFAVTALGAVAGAYTGLVIRHRFIGYQSSF